MQFSHRKRRSPPAVIIISLIDVLIVVLIFLMVTSSFKNQPMIKLVLPESGQAKPASIDQESLAITIAEDGQLFLGTRPVSYEQLRQHVLASAQQNPGLVLSISADASATVGLFIKINDLALEANVKNVNIQTRNPSQ
ncbi:MAG TPA: biopolymer transporter ExbD [Methylomirabilota bacterium]|nr:biopolymer transporter ExbD [Methylomirabilota bacterium]